MTDLQKLIYLSDYTKMRLATDEHLPLNVRQALRMGLVPDKEIPELVELYRALAWRKQWASAVLSNKSCLYGKQTFLHRLPELDRAIEMLPSVWAFDGEEWERIEPAQGETRNEYLDRVGGTKVFYELVNVSTWVMQGRGVVYTARLTSETTRDRLKSLIGHPLAGTDDKIIIGVESFCNERQRVGQVIGLLVKE